MEEILLKEIISSLGIIKIAVIALEVEVAAIFFILLGKYIFKK